MLLEPPPSRRRLRWRCDFLVRFSLRTGLSEAELTSYYDRINGGVYFQDGDPASAVVEVLETDDAGWDLRCR
ncbi:hypothetical protein ACFYUV_37470 [Nonomuraea sp. NPDC003560]|uniref:hypothetical protein n=1 Tax=Nonomuraea sp. NPDC003560 TaxID=3364341 RepID=UPI0036B827AF